MAMSKKPSRETVRKRLATRRRNAAARKKRREARLNNPTLGKEALRIAAIDRLTRDGASSTAALQRRVMVLAHERNLAPADYAKLMHKSVLTGHMLAFCKNHEVSVDWLMRGDLKGLQRMMQERRRVSQRFRREPARKARLPYRGRARDYSQGDRSVHGRRLMKRPRQLRKRNRLAAHARRLRR
jgi:hypothetical protein